MIRDLINRLFRRAAASTYTAEEALQIGRHFRLEREVKAALRSGLPPDEALREWDIYPYTKKQYEEWIKH
jgi:hypothetical protein